VSLRLIRTTFASIRGVSSEASFFSGDVEGHLLSLPGLGNKSIGENVEHTASGEAHNSTQKNIQTLTLHARMRQLLNLFQNYQTQKREQSG
jgi:hypothetical protein